GEEHGGLEALEGAATQLRQASAVGIVGQKYRRLLKIGLQKRLEGNVVKIQIIGIEHDGARGINAAGDYDADTIQAVCGEAAKRQELVTLSRDALGHLGGVQMGKWDRNARDDFPGIVYQADFDIGSADIHADL